VISSAQLASVAGFQVFDDVSIHAWPKETLKNAFFCFQNSVMSGQEMAMGILEHISH
jgi:hypothetical protein